MCSIIKNLENRVSSDHDELNECDVECKLSQMLFIVFLHVVPVAILVSVRLNWNQIFVHKTVQPVFVFILMSLVPTKQHSHCQHRMPHSNVPFAGIPIIRNWLCWNPSSVFDLCHCRVFWIDFAHTELYLITIYPFFIQQHIAIVARIFGYLFLDMNLIRQFFHFRVQFQQVFLIIIHMPPKRQN